MSLSVGKTNLLLRNLLRTPILELEASKLNLGTQTGWTHCIMCSNVHTGCTVVPWFRASTCAVFMLPLLAVDGSVSPVILQFVCSYTAVSSANTVCCVVLQGCPRRFVV
jgi:hypothetical protein